MSRISGQPTSKMLSCPIALIYYALHLRLPDWRDLYAFCWLLPIPLKNLCEVYPEHHRGTCMSDMTSSPWSSAIAAYSIQRHGRLDFSRPLIDACHRKGDSISGIFLQSKRAFDAPSRATRLPSPLLLSTNSILQIYIRQLINFPIIIS